VIQLFRGVADAEALAERWRSLEPFRPSVFQRHDLVAEWWRFYGDGRELAVAYAEDDRGRVLLPMFKELHEGRPRLRVLGAGAFDHLDVLLDGEPPLGELAAASGQLGYGLSIDVTPADSTLARITPRLFPSVEQRYFSAMPILATGRHQVQELRRQHARAAYRHRRLLSRDGGQVRELRDPEEACRVLARALELKRAALTEEQLRWFVPDDRYEQFLMALVSRCLGGLVRLAALTIEGEFAACVLYFADRGCWSLYFTAYDGRFARHSPGTVVLWELIERAADRRIPLVNFLTGEQWYKLRWHETLLPLVSIEARGGIAARTELQPAGARPASARIRR
jgi:CelD/BcsL family acetyltransferase involved in cellulose biosynthesis